MYNNIIKKAWQEYQSCLRQLKKDLQAVEKYDLQGDAENLQVAEHFVRLAQIDFNDALKQWRAVSRLAGINGGELRYIRY